LMASPNAHQKRTKVMAMISVARPRPDAETERRYTDAQAARQARKLANAPLHAAKLRTKHGLVLEPPAFTNRARLDAYLDSMFARGYVTGIVTACMVKTTPLESR
jgi:hypothetical protein